MIDLEEFLKICTSRVRKLPYPHTEASIKLPKLVNKTYGRAKMRKKEHIVYKKSKRRWKKKV